MDDIDKFMEEYHKEKELKRQKFLEKCLSKITDGELAYDLLKLKLCERFDIDTDVHPPEVIYIVLNHFVENVDEPFMEWLTKDDAPLIRPVSHLKTIFPELTVITENKYKLVELANKIYGLDLEVSEEYMGSDYIYSLSFDFNSFTPLPVDDVVELAREIEFCKKYNIDSDELTDKIKSYNIPKQALDIIMESIKEN